MTYAEAPEITTLNFMPSWKKQESRRLVAELISVNRESHREPDIYYFEMENGILIDPETGRPVLSFIAKDVEYQIAEELQTWANKNEEGISYWISPRSSLLKHPEEKIIIHRVAYTWDRKKIILNYSRPFSADLENPEELRKTFFAVEDTEENLFKILAWVEEVDNKPSESQDNQPLSREQAILFAERILRGESKYSVVEDMQRSGFLGKRSLTCSSDSKSPSFSDLITGNSSAGYEFHPGVCRICGATTEVGSCRICRACEKKF